MRRFSKSNVDLIALFLGGTLLFWLMGNLLHPMPTQNLVSSRIVYTSYLNVVAGVTTLRGQV
jgi:hypothetical protein